MSALSPQPVRFRGPRTGVDSALDPDRHVAVSADGSITCRQVDGVLVFNEEDYTKNFGQQWNQYDRTQLDSVTGDPVSEERLLLSLGVTPDLLAGRRVLEAGAGAGRFSEILIKHGAELYAFDASNAIFANCRNNGKDKAVYLQCSIYDIPFQPHQFDYVICLGVLQHTPDRALTIEKLAEQVRPGGRFCIDSYPWKFYHRFAVRYLLRPWLSRLPAPRLERFSRWFVDAWWPYRRLLRRDWVRRLASSLLPAGMAYYYNVSLNKSDDYLAYDVAQTKTSLRKKLEPDAKVVDMAKVVTKDGRRVGGFYVGRGVGPGVGGDADGAAVDRGPAVPGPGAAA